MIEFVDFSHVFERFSLEARVEMYNVFAYTSDYPILYRNTKENREKLTVQYGGISTRSCKWLVVKRNAKIYSLSEHAANTYIDIHIPKIYKCKKAWKENFKIPSGELDYSYLQRYFHLLFIRLPFDIRVKIYNQVASTFHEYMFLPDAEEDVVDLFYNDVHQKEYQKKRSYYFSRFTRWKRRLYIFKSYCEKVDNTHIYSKEEINEKIWEHINDICYRSNSWVEWMSYRPYITNIDDLPAPEYTSINRYYIYDDVDKWYYRDEFENKENIILL